MLADVVALAIGARISEFGFSATAWRGSGRTRSSWSTWRGRPCSTSLPASAGTIKELERWQTTTSPCTPCGGDRRDRVPARVRLRLSGQGRAATRAPRSRRRAVDDRDETGRPAYRQEEPAEERTSSKTSRSPSGSVLGSRLAMAGRPSAISAPAVGARALPDGRGHAPAARARARPVRRLVQPHGQLGSPQNERFEASRPRRAWQTSRLGFALVMICW